jgi:hypothetical protein
MKTTIFRWFIAVLALTILNINVLYANSDSVEIRIHFLHGSKPKREFRKTEDRWFGGILGGHAGVEYEPNKILNFLPRARFHVFSKQTIINSRFAIHDTISFYGILGGNPETNKKTIVTIKVSAKQKEKLDSVAKAYLERSPYDYAFFGMRCGAAAYDVLAQSGIVHKYSFTRTWRKFFYPRKVRRRLEHYARLKGFKVTKHEGSKKRKWEKD